MSDYRGILHQLLGNISSEIDNISPNVSYPRILNSMNSMQLIGVMKVLDSWIMSPDLNLSQLRNTSSNPTTDPLLLFHNVMNGYVVSTLAAIGLIFNIIGTCFLSSGPRLGQINSLLVSSLFTFNAIYLFFETLKSLELWAFTCPKKYFKTFLIFVNSGIRSSMISSILMLVAISRVRLCAIRKPFQYNNTILSWNERRNYWLRYCIPIVISSLILTLPLLLEIEDADTQTSETDLGVAPTDLRLHPVYSVLYVGVLNLGILGLMPIACLMYLAYHIIVELKKIRRRREVLGSVTQLSLVGINRSISSDETVTRGLVAVIIAFIGFHTFRVLITIGELCVLLHPNKENGILKIGCGVPTWVRISLSLNELFMVTNSSVNVLIYLKPYSAEFTKHFWPTRGENSAIITLTTS